MRARKRNGGGTIGMGSLLQRCLPFLQRGLLARGLGHPRVEALGQAGGATSIDGIRQAHISPVDGKPMRRADLREVEDLLATA